jgi:hypothetical protein
MKKRHKMNPNYYELHDKNHDWTVESVKDLLPSIMVKLPTGKIISADVSGRKLTFAKVNCLQGSWKCSWHTLVHILNTESELIV